MSKLEELIQELCPDGVEYKKLGEITTIKTGSKPKSIFEEPQIYEYINAGTSNSGFVTSYNCEGDTITTPSRGQGGIGYIGYQNNNFWLGPLCYQIRSKTVLALTRYIFFVLENNTAEIFKRKNEGGTPSLNREDLITIEVPVPPLEIQRGIVRILDEFTSLRQELSNCLTAELSARRKQYEYYRDELLTFGDDVPRVTLPEISENCDAQRKPVTKGKRKAGEYPYYGASGIVDYVADYLFDGDYLLISEDGANLTARVTPIAFSISGKNWVNNHAHILKFEDEKVRKFVEIYLNGMDLSSFISGGAQPKLNQANLNKIQIPFPDKEIIAEIVSVLENYEALCNNISSGLPAEIEARQKQYEYYRDKLVSFKRKESE